MESAMRSWGPRANRNCLIAVSVAILVLGAMTASRAAVTFFGLTFPDRVADAQLGSTNDFEISAPGWGYGVRYLQDDWAIDIYIYDRGRRSIPDDLASDVLKSELKDAQGEILELQRRGGYTKVELLRDYAMSDRRGRSRLLCSDFAYVHEKAGKVDSFLCLTGWHDKFVKFRLTGARHAGSDDEAKRFLAAWMEILWP
jgi:hypothetical protein